MTHLSPDDLMDIAEETRTEASASHLESCAACREQLANLREALSAIEDVDVPEPSPLFWEYLSTRIRDAVSAEQAARHGSWWRVGTGWWQPVTAMGAAAAVVAVLLTMRTVPEQSTSMAPLTVTAPTVLVFDEAVSVADDPSLSLLADLAGDLDLDAVAEAGMTMEDADADGVLTQLSDEERVELRRLLNEAMAGSGA